VRRCAWLVVAGLLAVGACTAETGEPSGGSASPPEAEAPVSESPGQDDDQEAPAEEPEPEPEPCRHDDLPSSSPVLLTDRTPAQLGTELAVLTHRCADAVVLAPDDDAWVAAIAAAAAVHLDAPLLLVGPDVGEPDAVTDQLERLEAPAVLTIGLAADRLPAGLDGPRTPDDAANGADAGEEVGGEVGDEVGEEVGEAGDGTSGGRLGDVEVTHLTVDDGDVLALARSVADHLDLSTLIAVPDDDVRGRAAALARLDGEVGILPLPTDGTPLSQVANGLAPTGRLRVLSSDEGEAERLADRLLAVGLDAVVASSPLFRNGTSTTWVVDPSDEVTAAVTAATARGRGDALLPIDAADLRRGGDDAVRLQRTNPEQVVVTGEVTPGADWQLDVVLNAPELPGGGFTLFEDRRMVALYGSPETTVLGAMGEQPLDETIPRLLEVAEPYGADGMKVLPAFEMIATIASANAEDTGDYSRRTAIEVIRPWVDRAAEEDIYVILDLQPGRTDFLTQAKEYEELLLEPHVGLALDPEWRLEPNQVHLQQIGSVEAEEVQEVADWLAELTREHHLPEKLLILHQFRFSMLPDRDTIEPPPELAVVVHMDGQGPLSAKYETYDAITAGAEDRWLWGWKNFYDEDEPTATPEQVLELDPLPVFVSYQ
jgi:hypothetical protein